MSKAITCPVIMTSASTRADGSLGIRIVTPELDPSEMAAVFMLRGQNLKMLLQPMDETGMELMEVKGELNEKTPSQRLRAVLFLLWKQNNEAIDFEVFYRSKMNAIIEKLKLNLNA